MLPTNLIKELRDLLFEMKKKIYSTAGMSIIKTVVLEFINDFFGKLSLSTKVHLDILEKYRIIDLVLIQNVSRFSEHLLYYLSIMLLLSHSYLSSPILSSC